MHRAAAQRSPSLRFDAARGWRGQSPSALIPRQPSQWRRGRGAFSVRAEAKAKGSLGAYLSESFMRIFSVPEDESVSWDKTYLPYEGKLDIHDQRRLRRLYEVVQAVRGCMDPNADNYSPGATVDDGSCVYPDGTQAPEGLKDYMQGAIERVVGHQFTGEDTEPEYGITPFSGQILSQREIDRL
eukprot:evm.model.scf_1797.3 EVM.evm.TU.scf_1797.3   scf_1797:11411-12581(+)